MTSPAASRVTVDGTRLSPPPRAVVLAASALATATLLLVWAGVLGGAVAYSAAGELSVPGAVAGLVGVGTGVAIVWYAARGLRLAFSARKRDADGDRLAARELASKSRAHSLGAFSTSFALVLLLDRLRRRVGMVFQSYNLFPHMTVRNNITLAPRKVLGLSTVEANSRADEFLERVGLSARVGYYPDQLSGGQQQRAAIVRSLAMDPEVVLLDEITSALDPELVAEVLMIVRELALDGMTMMLATHEMTFAREVSDLVVFLDEGVILEQGPPEQVFDDPLEARTREFLRKVVPGQEVPSA